jgi:acetylornithine deacetylase
MNSYLYEVLDRLIAFDTVSSNSDILAMEYLADELDRLGFKTALHKSEIARAPQANLVVWTGPPTADGLIISGHLDTVPYAGQPGWEREPLRMEVTDERIFGRGTTDMKGFIAQCADAARSLDRSRLRHPLVFIFTASEEIGGLGAQRVAPELPGLLGDVPCPSLAWIGEPTSWAIHAAHKSAVVVEITVRGKGGHSGAPDQGVNAIAVGGKVLEAVGRLQEERRQLSDPEYAAMFPGAAYDVMNVGTISGGIAENVIAEQCRLRVSYRSLPGTDPHALRDEIARRCAELDGHDYASHNHQAIITVGPAKVMPAMAARRGTPLEQALLRTTGARTVSGAPFCTDGGWFALAGINSLICGPGDYAEAHQPNESIGRRAFDRGPALMLEVIGQLCCDARLG